jgi:predicted aspartyl protease
MKLAKMFVAFLCTIPAASALSQPAPEPQPTCKLQAIAVLDMQTTDDGRVTVPVKIEGHDYRLLVDTGGYINTLSQQVVRREGYNPRQAAGGLVGMGTTRMNTYVTVKKFMVGHSLGENFDFYVDDFNNLAWDGLLAPQVLATYDVDFDFAHEKLSLISPDHCPGRVVYWTQEPAAIIPIEMQDRTHIRVPVTIDGKEIKATFDTGSHKSYMTLRAAAHYLDIDEKNPALKSLGNSNINGMVTPVYQYPFATLSFGDVTVNHPHIEIVSNEVWGERDLLLGASILRQLHLYIAYKEKKLYVTPALAH